MRPPDPEEAKSLGLTLMVLRRHRGLTTKALSQACNSTRSNLSLYETGRMMPRYDTIVRIVKALDLPIEAFWRAQALIDQATGGEGAELPAARLEPTPDRPTALRLAQEIGKAVAHVTLAALELGAGGWPQAPR
jgi:transcriptional regulator with XRE-family HTH domain